MSKSLFNVPWYNIAEWISVKKILLSEDLTKWKRAYEIMQMWKARFPALPMYIECTMGLLQVIVEDHCSGQAEGSELIKVLNLNDKFVLEYSTAIVRFVNHVSADYGLRGETLYKSAFKNKIPDWVVNLRHDIAHSSSLPSLDLLRSAANFAVHWLLENYWSSEELNMSALDGSAIDNTVEVDLTRLQGLLKCGLTAWRKCCIALKEGRRWTSDLEDKEWLSVLTFQKRLRRAKLISGRSITSQLQEAIRKGSLLRSPDWKNSKKRGVLTFKVASLTMNVMQVLSSKGPALRKNMVESLFQTDFLIDGGANWRRWKFVINMLDECDSLGYLLRTLFIKLVDENVAEQAAGWLTVLAPSIAILHQVDKIENKTADVEFPENCIILKVRKPPSIALEMLAAALHNPTNVTVPVIEKYLNLLNPPLPENISSTIKKLLNIFIISGQCADDISISNDVEMFDVSSLNYQDRQKKIKRIGVTNGGNTGVWTKLTLDADVMKRCPLGVLPGQVMPELDLSDLAWRFRPGNARRAFSS